MQRQAQTILTLILIAAISSSYGQKQLVLLKGEHVIERYYPGDDFNFRLKGSGVLQQSFVNDLFPDAVKIYSDTIPFQSIKRVYLLEERRYRGVQALGTLVRAAGLFFLFDDFNSKVYQGKKSDHQAVAKANIFLYDPGVSLMFIRRKSFRLRGKYRLMMVEKGSIFYRPNPNTVMSPFE